MVTAIIGVGEIVRDFGLSSAAVQARTLSDGQRSNLFWINAGIGLALTAVVCLCSGLIAAFYDDPRLVAVTLALSSTFFINGLMTQYKANLNRSMRFVALTGIEVGGQAIGLVTGVGLALAGWGYWSLVAQQLAQILVQLVALVIATRWIPRLYDRSEPVREFLSYGASLMGVMLLSYASNHVDSIVIGARFGPTSLGIYNRAFQLMVLPLYQINAPMTRVALPVLSRLQDEKERYRAFLLTGQTAMLTVVSFLLGFAAAQAPAVILISLGDQWGEAAPIFQILTIAAFFTMAGYATHWVYLSLGLTNQSLRISFVTRPLMILAVLLGSVWGVQGVAWAYAVSVAISWPINLWWLARVSDAPVGTIAANGSRTIVIYLVACAASWLSTVWIPASQPWAALAVGGAAMVATLGLTALVLPAYREDLVRTASILKYLRKRN